MQRVLLLAAALAALVAARPAFADQPSILVGHGDHVSVAAEPDGTTHVVWAMRVRGHEFNAIGYCRLPSYALQCTDRKTLLVLDPTLAGDARPFVRFQPPNTVTIVDTRCCDSLKGGRYTLLSTDGGKTFELHHPTTLQAPAHRHDRLSVLRNDGVLVVIGTSNSTFGLPTSLRVVNARSDVTAPETVPATPFAGTGSNTVYTTDLSVLPDGRLIAIGQHKDVPTVDGIWSRVQARPGADPADAAAWTPWRRILAEGYPESVAAGRPGDPTTLLYFTVKKGGALHLGTLTAGGLVNPRLFAGNIGVRPTNAFDVAQATWAAGRLNAVWTSDQEGCPRLHRCLIYRRTFRDGLSPKEVVRSLPATPGGKAIWQPSVSAPERDAVAAWVERPLPDGVGDIRVARVCVRSQLACVEHNDEESEGADELIAPVGLVTARSFSVRFFSARRHNPIRKVIFKLLPPHCVRDDSGCLTLPRPVVITDDDAPFEATFSGLPNQASITSAVDPLQNRLCELQAYVYTVEATLFAAHGGQLPKKLYHDISYCPLIP